MFGSQDKASVQTPLPQAPNGIAQTGAPNRPNSRRNVHVITSIRFPLVALIPKSCRDYFVGAKGGPMTLAKVVGVAE
jgi:hypothetical protein